MNTTNLTFTDGQLALLRSCATECIGDGTPTRTSDEWAVFETVSICHGFHADQLVIMHLIAKECEKRHLGAMSVYDSVVAFNRIYGGEDLPEYPALVARAVDSLSPEIRGFGRFPIGPICLN